MVFFSGYLPLGGQGSSDSEERIQSSLCAPLSALHNLLAAVSYPVLTAHRNPYWSMTVFNKWLKCMHLTEERLSTNLTKVTPCPMTNTCLTGFLMEFCREGRHLYKWVSRAWQLREQHGHIALQRGGNSLFDWMSPLNLCRIQQVQTGTSDHLEHGYVLQWDH